MEVRRHSSAAAVAEAWDELAERTGAAPWLRPGWTAAWWAAFGRGRLEVVTVHDGGELVGLCPVELRRGVRAATANWHSPTFAPVADGPDALEALAAGLLSPRGAAMLELRPLPAEDPAAAVLGAVAGRRGARTLQAVHMRSPFLQLDDSFEAFCARRPPGRSLLKDIRRNRRGLEAEGELSFEVHDGSARLDALLAEGFAVESAGWQGAEGSAIASSARTWRFYTDVAHWAASRDLLRLMFLRLDGRAIAFEYCLLHGGVLADLKGGYRLEHRKRSPGMLIALEAIRWAHAQSLTGLDFLGGDDAYKLRWTEHVRERSVLRVFPGTPAGYAAWAAWRHGRPAADRALAVGRRAAIVRARVSPQGRARTARA